MAILHYGFAINDCRFAAEVGSGANNRGIAGTPIMSIAAEHTRLTALNHQLRAVAIVLDFVNPVLPLWRLIDRGSKLWLDEPEFGGYARHGIPRHLQKKPQTVDTRASSAIQERQ